MDCRRLVAGERKAGELEVREGPSGQLSIYRAVAVCF